MSVPLWITKTSFRCDITNKYCNYSEMHLAWYDKWEKPTRLRTNFMIVHYTAFKQLENRQQDGWSLNDRTLEEICADNLIVFFSAFIVPDRIHKSDIVYKSELSSWIEALRRLTIPKYEEARTYLHMAKDMDEFYDYTEAQLLETKILSKFVKEVQKMI